MSPPPLTLTTRKSSTRTLKDSATHSLPEYLPFAHHLRTRPPHTRLTRRLAALDASHKGAVTHALYPQHPQTTLKTRPKTLSPGHGYGFFWVQVRETLEYPQGYST